MGTRNPRFEIPTWMAGVVGILVLTAVGYVFVFGGEPIEPVLLTLGAFGVGLALFTVYLFYRFVLAVETIAEKH